MYKNRKAKWIKSLVLTQSQSNKKGLLSQVESNLQLEDFVTDDWLDQYEKASEPLQLVLFLKVRGLTLYLSHWRGHMQGSRNLCAYVLHKHLTA